MTDRPGEGVEQTDPVEAMADAIENHYDDDQCGAPLGCVVEEMLGDPSIDVGDVGHALREGYFHGVIYQPSQSTVARVATDGGGCTENEIEQVRDPTEDPAACSKCGVHIGAFPQDEYCDGCARELGLKPPMVRCTSCGRRAPEEHMEAIDVSPPDEYYPEFEYLCQSCSRDDGGEQDG
jgi:hypothetical protein